MKILQIMKNKIIYIYKSPDYFWEFLNENDENIKLQKAKKQIKSFIPVVCFSMSIYLVITWTTFYFNTSEKIGSNYIFLFGTYIFTCWAFVIVNIKKIRIRRFLQHLKENFQQQHG